MFNIIVWNECVIYWKLKLMLNWNFKNKLRKKNNLLTGKSYFGFHLRSFFALLQSPCRNSCNAQRRRFKFNWTNYLIKNRCKNTKSVNFIPDRNLRKINRNRVLSKLPSVTNLQSFVKNLLPWQKKFILIAWQFSSIATDKFNRLSTWRNQFRPNVLLTRGLATRSVTRIIRPDNSLNSVASGFLSIQFVAFQIGNIK